MDLLDFSADDLYFDETSDPVVAKLLARAADAYGSPQAEQLLLQAYFRDPHSLTVLVALYRYYYYQHRYADALEVAERAMITVAEPLGIDADWRQVDERSLAAAGEGSMTRLRFYLYALKGAAYLEMRMGEPAQALQRLRLIARIDQDDRIGVRSLIHLADAAASRDLAGSGIV